MSSGGRADFRQGFNWPRDHLMKGNSSTVSFRVIPTLMAEL
ncbi:hypothetical protein LINGRAHAP2_LOCUS8356 [Linum grandiflorum]